MCPLNIIKPRCFPFVSGFDHGHPEVYEHCKRLLLHLLIVMGSGSNVQSVASVLLRNREFNESRVLTVKQTTHLDYTFTGMLLIYYMLLVKMTWKVTWFSQPLIRFLVFFLHISCKYFPEALALKFISLDFNPMKF